MARLTRDEIRNVRDLPEEVVAVPEWGGEVTVRGMTGKARDQFERWMVDFKSLGKNGKGGLGMEDVDMRNVRAKVVVLTCVGEDGELIFDEKDLGWLGEKSGVALDRVAGVGMRLSGLGEGVLEGLGKN